MTDHVTRVVDVETLGMAVRELAAGHDSVAVVVYGKAGAVLGTLRTRTPQERAEAEHVRPGPRPAPRALRPPFQAAPLRAVEPVEDILDPDDDDLDGEADDATGGQP